MFRYWLIVSVIHTTGCPIKNYPLCKNVLVCYCRVDSFFWDTLYYYSVVLHSGLAYKEQLPSSLCFLSDAFLSLKAHQTMYRYYKIKNVFSCPKGSSIGDKATGAGGGGSTAAVLRKSSLEAAQGHSQGNHRPKGQSPMALERSRAIFLEVVERSRAIR